MQFEKKDHKANHYHFGLNKIFSIKLHKIEIALPTEI